MLICFDYGFSWLSSRSVLAGFSGVALATEEQILTNPTWYFVCPVHIFSSLARRSSRSRYARRSLCKNGVKNNGVKKRQISLLFLPGVLSRHRRLVHPKKRVIILCRLSESLRTSYWRSWPACLSWITPWTNFSLKVNTVEEREALL